MPNAAIKVFTYVGDGVSPRTISWLDAFVPDAVIVTGAGAPNDSWLRTTDMSGTQTRSVPVGVFNPGVDGFQSLGASSFVVGSLMNTLAGEYHVQLFRNVAGLLTVGKQLAGTPLRHIDIGYQPNWLMFVGPPLPEMSGIYALDTQNARIADGLGGPNLTDAGGFDATGFTYGAAFDADDHHFIALAAPHRQVYTGNGGSQAITGVGFQARWLSIMRTQSGIAPTAPPVLHTTARPLSFEWRLVFDRPTAVLSIGPDGFTVGAYEGVNGAGVNYSIHAMSVVTGPPPPPPPPTPAAPPSSPPQQGGGSPLGLTEPVWTLCGGDQSGDFGLCAATPEPRAGPDPRLAVSEPEIPDFEGYADRGAPSAGVSGACWWCLLLLALLLRDRKKVPK